jgi:nucleotide-binding universal stress UspA family protein
MRALRCHAGHVSHTHTSTERQVARDPTNSPAQVLRLVIGYDGSPSARNAVDFAAASFKGSTAVLVHVAAIPLPPVGAMVPLGAPVVPTAAEEAHFERLARSIAQDGVARARRAGLEAEAETRVGTGSSAVAARLLDVAEERNADLIVLGHRDLGTLEALLHASVSRSAVQDGRKPVLVVPSHDA